MHGSRLVQPHCQIRLEPPSRLSSLATACSDGHAQCLKALPSGCTEVRSLPDRNRSGLTRVGPE